MGFGRSLSTLKSARLQTLEPWVHSTLLQRFADDKTLVEQKWKEWYSTSKLDRRFSKIAQITNVS